MIKIDLRFLFVLKSNDIRRQFFKFFIFKSNDIRMHIFFITNLRKKKILKLPSSSPSKVNSRLVRINYKKDLKKA